MKVVQRKKERKRNGYNERGTEGRRKRSNKTKEKIWRKGMNEQSIKERKNGT